MTLRQITGVYLPRSQNVASQSSSSSAPASYSSCSSHSSSPLARCFVFIMAHVTDSVPKEPFRMVTSYL